MPTHDPRGSQWRRWDLHVHTPASIIQNYGGDTSQAWQKYITDLRNLPSDIAVIAITDYLFLDGYERVKDEHKAGNLPNLALILPAVEFRIKSFAGTDSTLRKINYHVLFSNELDVQQITTQFLNVLTADYYLNEDDHWNQVVNRDTLTEFGNRVLDNNAELRATNVSALKAGFNNLTFSYELLEEKLTTNTALRDKYVTAIGLNEWNDMRWQQSSADKRNIIQRVDFLLTAADTPEACNTAREKLITQRVNRRLIDASDAHNYSSSRDKDRLGNCHTWIKADTTFEGLRQVRESADERIYLGALPEKEQLVRDHPTRFIDQLTIRPNANNPLTERWFNNTIPFNYDLVAIIGNKGMGKSALTDIIALTSNADAPPDKFGFLADNKFRDRKDNKAKHFHATITWRNGETLTRGLNDNVPSGTIAQVRYLPQNYFEDLCNETKNPDQLQRELRGVIFSNLTPQQRGRYANLDELIAAHMSQAERQIDDLRAELHTANRDIVTLERELSKKRQKELEDALRQQEAALTAHDENKPAIVAPPAEQASTPELDKSRTERDTLDATITETRARIQALYENQQRANTLLARFGALQETIAKLRITAQDDLLILGIPFEALLAADVNLVPLEARATAIAISVEDEDASIHANDGLLTQRTRAQEQIKTLQDALDAPGRAYQQYLDRLKTWQEQRAAIVGTIATAGSVEYLKARLTTERNAQRERLDTLQAARSELTRKIHKQQRSITEFQATLYEPAANRLINHPVIKAQLDVNFTSTLVDTGMASKFSERINRNPSGPFRDEHAMRDYVTPYELNDADQMEQFLSATLDRLHETPHGEAGDIDDVQRQLRKDHNDIEDLYNFLYGLTYLEPRYELRVRQRSVAQLTPGERGSLLLVFYLLIDQDDRPLIIDQPEENLDNQSVFELLVPCIKEAKERRQIVIVTHNPNLAVVCNAEQIIWCKIEKDTDHAVRYVTGGIENPEINQHLIDVLEGTRPAFDDRGSKYQDLK